MEEKQNESSHSWSWVRGLNCSLMIRQWISVSAVYPKLGVPVATRPLAPSLSFLSFNYSPWQFLPLPSFWSWSSVTAVILGRWTEFLQETHQETPRTCFHSPLIYFLCGSRRRYSSRQQQLQVKLEEPNSFKADYRLRTRQTTWQR